MDTQVDYERAAEAFGAASADSFSKYTRLAVKKAKEMPTEDNDLGNTGGAVKTPGADDAEPVIPKKKTTPRKKKADNGEGAEGEAITPKPKTPRARKLKAVTDKDAAGNGAEGETMAPKPNTPSKRKSTADHSDASATTTPKKPRQKAKSKPTSKPEDMDIDQLAEGIIDFEGGQGVKEEEDD